MNNEDKILEMLGAMQQDIQNMKSDMRGVKTEITVTVNALVEWTDKVSAVYELPLPKL